MSWRERLREAWIGGGLLVVALLALVWGGESAWRLASGLSVLAGLLFLPRGQRGRSVPAPYPFHVLGVLGMAGASWWAEGPPWVSSAAWGAWLGACSLALRVAFDRHGQEPIEMAALRLRAAPGDHLRPEDSSSAGVAPFVPVSAARAGDRIVVRAGEAVPLDGVVDQGRGDALLHPSAACVSSRGVGQPLLAGARLLSGEVRLLVTRVGEERGLLRALRFGEELPQGARRFPRRLAWEPWWLGGATLVGALVFFVASGGGASGLMRASAFLLAAPLLGVLRGARDPWRVAAVVGAEHGIVFRDEESLERAGEVRRVAFARRGVVTLGEPVVVEVRSLDPTWSSEALLGLAAGLESVAEGDPVARAVVRHAQERGVTPLPVRRARVVPARGIAGIGPDGEPVAFGNRQLLISEGVGGALADEAVAEVERRGETALLLASGGRVRGILALHDELSPGVRPAVQRLFDLGVDVVLLSGDHRGTLETQARSMGLLHVESELTPEERGEVVERLLGGGGTVGALGRSPEHDPILLQADVPAVLDGAGSPAGERGIGLTTSDPRQASLAFWLAHRAMRASRRETGFAAALGAGVLTALALQVATPLAAVAMGVAVDLAILPLGRRLYGKAQSVLEALADAAARDSLPLERGPEGIREAMER